MNKKEIFKCVKAMNKDLIKQSINRAFTSMCSNVFFEFGNKIEINLPNNKKDFRKEWIIWISHASWRITKGEKYIIGSNDDHEMIQSELQNLLNVRLISFQFISQFLDIEFCFEEDYKITTFFNWTEENQWTIFLPDGSNIGIDCSSNEEIRDIIKLSKSFNIKDNYNQIQLPINGLSVIEINFNEENETLIHFESEFFLFLKTCAWRLEREENYLIGNLDKNPYHFLKMLKGKRIRQVKIANELKDAEFQFEDGYILKTFSCIRYSDQWKIKSSERDIFSNSIEF